MPDSALSVLVSAQNTPTDSREETEPPENTPTSLLPTETTTTFPPTLTVTSTLASEPSPTTAPSATPKLEPTPIPDFVTYDVEQTFKISNEGPSPVSTLRLTTARIQSMDPYQEVLSFEIIPPLEYKEKSDELNNQFVEFEFLNIKPGEDRLFTLKYEVTAYREQVDPGLCEGELIPGFTQPEKHIESDAEQIILLSQQLSAGAENVCQQVKAFYDFVADTLEYVPDCTREDYGALKALEYRSGDCTEFSDLLIALTRSAGIPARFIEGVVPDPGSEKHDWAQVYLPGMGWVTMEPTWGQIDGLREIYFAGTTPDHIILTTGRNLSTLNNKHYWTSRFWWNNELSQPLVKIDSVWNLSAKE